MYMCSQCKYESRRHFNVRRHEGRIHGIAKKQRECCGTIFVTKGEFYEHCEMVHPDLRKWASISKKKYKMVGNACLDIKLDLPAMDDAYCPSTSECETQATNVRRMSERIKKKAIATLYHKIKPIGKLEFEDVPLIYFLNMPSKVSYLKSIYSLDMIKMEPETSMLGTDIKNDENFGKGQEVKTENGCVRTQAEESMEQMLPLKKLILTKFLNSGFENPECESGRGVLKNHNAVGNVFKKEEEVKGQVPRSDFEKKIRVPKKRGKFSKRKSNKSNAENIPFNNQNDGTFTLSGWDVELEENIFLKIDDNVNWPLATEIHRDFLGSIDFDRL
ncbi:uncharacterized protein LOC107272433 [Cephus cinctus]|uniref:Uncharacterized protein LOC107272433 n=1 Tax=Cephus cinctus TaxID=211228 RepID=A0AAJ7CA16_CEPCN|nr:uncharacterized protein LOC107272433 [Cephus cinctus]